MTTQTGAADPEHRVLIFAPVGRDAELTRDLLRHAAIPCLVCRSLRALTEKLTESGGGAVLLTGWALDDRDYPELVASLEHQPPWSDVPVILFAGGPAADVTVRAIGSIDTLRNVALLGRPIRVAAVLSTLRAALRGRVRQ